MLELKKDNIKLKRISDYEINELSFILREYYPNLSISKLRSFLESKNILWENKKEFFMTVYSNNEIVGLIGIENYKLISKEGDISLLISERFKKSGISYIATKLFLGFLFNNLRFEQVFLKIDKKVTGPIPLILDLGFKKKLNLSFRNDVYVLKKKNFSDE